MGRLSDSILELFGGKTPTIKSPQGLEAVSGSTSALQLNPIDAQHVPAADCLSCKIIGTGTLLVASGYVTYFTLKHGVNFSGIRRYLHYGQGASLTILLLALAGSRAFDKGFFDKTRQDETLLEASKKDLKYVFQSLGYELPKFFQDTPSDGDRMQRLATETTDQRQLVTATDNGVR